jgi:1,4-dihydroxy-2-naphthoyl-CoA hydrolase
VTQGKDAGDLAGAPNEPRRVAKSRFRPELTPGLLNGRSKGYLPGLAGVEVVALDESGLRSRLAVRKDLMAPNGFLHAATVIALADTSCGYGCIAFLPEGAKGFTTIELKCNFLGTVREGAIACAATPVHLGRNTHVWDAVVSDEAGGKSIALFRCTQMVLW